MFFARYGLPFCGYCNLPGTTKEQTFPLEIILILTDFPVPVLFLRASGGVMGVTRPVDGISKL